MYDIEIDYTTGGSFSSERLKENICNVVSDLDKAKENLRRVKKHYIKYHDHPNFGKRYELTLLIDDGERTISPFWIGYFEELHGARVVTDVDSDMEFEL